MNICMIHFILKFFLGRSTYQLSHFDLIFFLQFIPAAWIIRKTWRTKFTPNLGSASTAKLVSSATKLARMWVESKLKLGFIIYVYWFREGVQKQEIFMAFVKLWLRLAIQKKSFNKEIVLIYPLCILLEPLRPP